MTQDSKCPICDASTKKPFTAAFWHFRFIESGSFRYWRGNVKAFGFASGLVASICLSFPFLNTIINWRHRKSRLVIHGVGQQEDVEREDPLQAEQR